MSCLVLLSIFIVTQPISVNDVTIDPAKQLSKENEFSVDDQPPDESNLSIDRTKSKDVKKRKLRPFSRDSIILITNERSGSTFLGNLLSSDPDTYYMFEPLKLMETNILIEDDSTCVRIENKLRSLIDLMECKVNVLMKT